jgi:anti-anti-sigma factor
MNWEGEEQMEITVSQQQGRVPVTVFHIEGDIDVTSYEQLLAKAREAIAAGTRYLLLDLAHVGSISSAGLRALQSIFTEFRAGASAADDEAVRRGMRDGTYKSPNLKLLSPSPKVLQVLSMAGFDMFLEIHRDLKKAVASF